MKRLLEEERILRGRIKPLHKIGKSQYTNFTQEMMDKVEKPRVYTTFDILDLSSRLEE